MDVLVVGAGVSGLTTAVCLAEAGSRVVVRAAEPPARTTSAVAGAMCGLSVTGPDDPATRWAEVSTAEFRALAGRADTGVRIQRGRLVSNRGDAPPPWAPALPGFGRCGEEEKAGYRVGFWAELPFADMPVYLAYLADRLVAAGGVVEIGPVGDLAEAGRALAPGATVVNCTGVGARDLVPDPLVRAVKGQHVIVENPGIDDFFFEGGAADAWVGYVPHGDRVVLGGIALQDDWDREPEPSVSEQILARCVAVEPRLADARVLSVEAGLRPVRPTVRVAVENRDGVRCIHNYGHGSIGVTLSWGCALDVVALVTSKPVDQRL
jgi:D-amino-acid oxidase